MFLASITDSVVHFATNVVADMGLIGIFLLMLAESACLPIPSEATMLFAGFGVSEGRFSLLAITVAGIAGNLAGSWLAYGAGYFGRTEFIDRQARRLHIKRSHIEWADRWFARYGELTVFFTRMLPIIRTFISLPAGVARMPFWRFTAATLLGCVPWVLMLAFIGDQVGANWTQWKDSLRYVDYAVVVALVGLIGYVTARRLRARRAPAEQRSEAGHASAPPGPESGHAGAPPGSESRDQQRQVQASEQDRAGAKHEAGLGREMRDAAIPRSPPVARISGEDGGEAAEVPRESEEQRNQSEGNAERSKHAGHRRTAAVEDVHAPIDQGRGARVRGSRKPRA